MLVAGYPSSFEVVVEGTPLPVTAQLRAQFRLTRGGPVLIETTSADGGISVPEPGRIRFTFTGAHSANLPDQPLMFDVVRTDGAEPEYLGFEGTVKFHRPITR